MRLTSASAQRGIAVAAGLLLAALAGLAVASHFRDSAPAPKLPARVGNWYQARAAPMRADLEGTTTACGVELGRQTMGLADPVLPCGARLLIRFGGQTVLTEVIDNRLKSAGRQFELTDRLAQELGVNGTQEIDWRFARPPNS